MSYKNKLQEYCQQKGFPLPVYSSRIVSGDPHSPQWVATLTAFGNKYHSDPKNNKREAEQQVACDVFMLTQDTSSTLDLSKAETKESDNKPVTPTKPATPTRSVTPTKPDTPDSKQVTYKHIEESLTDRRLAFIDLENIQPVFNLETQPTLRPKYQLYTTSTTLDLPASTQPEVKMYGFLSTYSTVDVSKYKPYMEIVTIDSPVTEAADHLLTYTIGKMIGNKQITKTDHISIVSRDKASAIIVHMLQHEGYQVTHYKNAKDFESSL